ncbi:uncharacterized protein MONBRDRAFT_36587 [Monosiga brevicollis MX1]|uniref:Uncharacterized protein n=1 Tax=Monosiga brevicollis TaxID=81824 RepID=A9UW96_MONBE|nr:uncharacterized protein MONBRDRAFT_36587 [Monosiga brevicollis MX1]EDQ90726.1 predicted protein [Monosiga brevicollis MX1]|eukprot:XP_001744777.1 hypothetical protein [Monosiga brevicollis MX1]
MPETRRTVFFTVSCFLVSFVLTVTALGTPAWIITDFQGMFEYGLFVECTALTYNGEQRRTCGKPAEHSGQWQATAAFIIMGLLVLVGAIGCATMAIIRQRYMDYARWAGFTAAIFYSIASLIFPVGFTRDDIGGEPYRLPEHTGVGFSYILFVLALIFIFIGELVAMKIVCQ